MLALLSGSEATTGLVNSLASRLLPVGRLPALDYRRGIPADARTLVVFPCLLDSLDGVGEFTDQLERHYLSGPRGEVYCALLSDWPDSETETAGQDKAVLDHARDRIEALAQL